MTSDLVMYKIDASRCDLRVGDLVAPGRMIGQDLETGSTLESDAHGQVEGVYFSGADHALVILIRMSAPRVLAEGDRASDES
jgi:hypothetical protein